MIYFYSFKVNIQKTNLVEGKMETYTKAELKLGIVDNDVSMVGETISTNTLMRFNSQTFWVGHNFSIGG